MASKKHTHKYHCVTTDTGPIWACALPDCNHFMPAHYTKLLPGKASICWGCGDAFILTTDNMKMAQPVCPDCDPNITQLQLALKDKETSDRKKQFIEDDELLPMKLP